MASRRPIRLTVTGFVPFSQMARNPSADLIRRLEQDAPFGWRFAPSFCVLPVAYETAEDTVNSLIENTQPEILIMTGLAADTRVLRLERCAKNLDDSPAADNRNCIRRGQPIVAKGAPRQYCSPLPLDAFAVALRAARIPAAVSDDAGGFVCNHCYFIARQRLHMSAVPAIALFVHIPKLGAYGADSTTGMSLETVSEGIVLLASWMDEYRRRSNAIIRNESVVQSSPLERPKRELTRRRGKQLQRESSEF